MSSGHHLQPDRRRLALLIGGLGPLLPAGGRLGNEVDLGPLSGDRGPGALRQRSPEEGLIHHSDRGCQYASEDQQAILTDHCMLGSMGRRGNCLDNAPVESFFGTLKTERVRRRQYRTRSEAKRDLFLLHRGVVQSKTSPLSTWICEPDGV